MTKQEANQIQRMIKGWYKNEIIKTRITKYGLFLYGHCGVWFLSFFDDVKENMKSLNCFIQEQRDLKNA